MIKFLPLPKFINCTFSLFLVHCVTIAHKILICIDVPYSLTRTKLRTTYYYEYIFEEIPAYVNSNVPWIDVEVEPSYAFLCP